MNLAITRHSFGAWLCLLLALMIPSLGVAQSGATGTIAGRVFNPATGEFLRNAQIRIEETGQSDVSGSEGDFRFNVMPVGDYTLAVIYTGYHVERRKVTVSADSVATADFDLVSTLQRSPSGDAVLLSAFEVSSEREGNAKAIMDQRRSMNITNTVAADIFGDDAEGNLGEFLKHLPGVSFGGLSFGEVRNIGLRGLSPEYTSVTVDGVSLSSTDPNSGGSTRAFTFEQVSLSSMDTIEISKTISADVDASAPGGTINLKTKRAFEREGRRIVVQANLAAHSEQFHFNRSPRPGDGGRSRKIRPGGIFEYSDVFMNKRLGVVLSISESNLYQEVFATSLTFNRTPTSADPRPVVITAVEMTHSPRLNERFTTTLTTDFKATERLVLSLGTIFNWSDLWMAQENVSFNTGARNTVIGNDPLLSFRTTNAGSVALAPAGISKRGETFTYIPKFEYKVGSFVLEGKFAASISRGWYDPLTRHGTIRNMVSPTASGVVFEAKRSSLESADWRFTQLGGPNLADGLSYSSVEANINDGRRSRTEVYTGDISATFKTSRVLPVVWKMGVKRKQEVFDYKSQQGAIRYKYIGPGSGAMGGWAPFPSALAFDAGSVGGSITTLSGRPLFHPNLHAIGQAYLARPQDFELFLPASNYFTANVTNTRYLEEQVDAAFLMGTTTFRKATFRVGVRYEGTSTDSLEFDPLPNEVVRAAGFPVTSRATTIPGIDYQFFTNPRVHRKGDYDNVFPSASFKYDFSTNLSLQLGYSSTIRRPTISQLAGVWQINDQTLRATVPNVGLTPETSDNYALRLAYYFEPVGILGVNFFQNTVDGLHETNELTAAEFGYTDADLQNYTFVTTTNSAERTQIRGMELEYSQSLSFLPGYLSGLAVRGSYTRNYAETIMTSVAPHAVSLGVSYSYRRLNASLNGIWNDDRPTNTGGTSFIRQRTSVDLSAGYRISKRYRFFINARNLTNTPYISMQQPVGQSALQSGYQVFGTTWTAGVKAVF